MAQMANMMIHSGNLKEVADLKDLDMICFVIAGACHDFRHDGYNNEYHVNSMSERAVRYHDESV